MKIIKVVPAMLAMLVSAYGQADELTDATQALCDTVKSCALEQIAAQQDLTDEIREKMAPQLNEVCANMRAQVQSVPTDHALYKPAVGCVRSMVSLGCQQLQTPGGAQTPECNEYQKLARPADSAN